MAQITITAPDAWVAAITGDIEAGAEDVSGSTFCGKVLAAWGKTFDQLTSAEKVQLFCLHSMWRERARRRGDDAGNTASTAAVQDTIDEFNP